MEFWGEESGRENNYGITVWLPSDSKHPFKIVIIKENHTSQCGHMLFSSHVQLSGGQEAGVTPGGGFAKQEQ